MIILCLLGSQAFIFFIFQIIVIIAVMALAQDKQNLEKRLKQSQEAPFFPGDPRLCRPKNVGFKKEAP